MGSGLFFSGTLRFFFFSLISAVAAAQRGGEGGSGRELWCVAMNNAEDSALQAALDWACGPGGADCGPIQSGGPCYDSSDLQRTASYAFNDYYIKHSSSDDSCSFSGNAALTSLNPSHNNCRFPSSLNTGNVNNNGSIPAGSDSADLSSSNSITHHWDWGSILIHLFLSLALIFRG